MIEKLRNCFDEMVVYKDLKKSNFFSALSLPSFMRDWLLKKFEDENGNFNQDELLDFVRIYLPRKDDWTAIKNQVVIEHERVKFLAKVSVDIDIRTGGISFALPDFGLTSKDTIIEDHVWQTCKDDLVHGCETWGMVEIGYRPPDDYDTGYYKDKSRGANRGKIKLTAFKTFCPYTIDIDYYKEVRCQFTTAEWLDVLLGAVDYNASGYLGDEEKKLTMLTRLLPFVEKRLNLIELAPKGTGKSYLFGRVSRFGWLSSGGILSRAKMFYDQNKRTEGLVSGNDFIVLDEVQTISFTNVDEMRAALKGYLESGVFTVGNYEGTADAGVVLCGNIKKETMDEDGYGNMFEELPPVFHESALIERFHGFIKGWNIPRMNDDLKIAGWALNSEYFCSIMHELRDDMSYRAVVDDLIEVPEAADTRDTEAVKRIATAYLKLLFPQVRSADDITAREFKRYCLDRARKMRDTIRYQLGILDVEYRGKDIPALTVKPDPKGKRNNVEDALNKSLEND
ncbi:MAG: BREX system Lon protease-like protein BrxL [Firmicutes bacterium]|nr:BREX system Lon protease-like protein BrxL [Bacillota bacterium]